jgi:bacterioferritin-associated ferredoxin
MIACICRDISEDDYPDLKSLLERLSQPDAQCGKCNEYYRGLLGENKNGYTREKINH